MTSTTDIRLYTAVQKFKEKLKLSVDKLTGKLRFVNQQAKSIAETQRSIRGNYFVPKKNHLRIVK